MAVAWLLALAACEDGSGARRSAVADTLAGGAVLVSNEGPGRWAEAPGWTLHEELRVGSAEGGGPDAFGKVWALEVDRHGRIHVADGRPPAIRVFRPDGSHLRTLGGEGAGPGEFRWPVGLELDDPGRLWVVDYRNARYTVFDTAGSLVRTSPRPLPGRHVPWPGRFDGGRLVEVGVLTASGDVEALVAVDTAGGVRDTLGFPAFRGRHVPFAAELLWTLGPDGRLWLAESDRYRIHRVEATGDTSMVVERTVEAEPLTEREKGEALDAMKARLGRLGASTGLPELSDLPARKPLLRDLWLDDEGFLWVLPREGAEDGAGQRLADVFDPEGAYLGRLRLPVPVETTPRPVFREGRMYAVTEDALGVQYVVRLGIVLEGERPAGGERERARAH